MSCELQPCRSINAPKMWVFGPLPPLSWLQVKWHHFRPLAVTWRHFLSHDRHILRVLAMWEHRRPKCELSASYSHFRVTFAQMTSLPGQFRSRDIILCHLTAMSCELQPCRSINAAKMWVFGPQQPLPMTSGQMTSLPGYFRHLRSRKVICCHLSATSGELQPCRGINWRKPRFWPPTATFGWLSVKWRHFRPLEVTWHHFLSRHCHILQVTAL